MIPPWLSHSAGHQEFVWHSVRYHEHDPLGRSELRSTCRATCESHRPHFCDGEWKDHKAHNSAIANIGWTTWPNSQCECNVVTCVVEMHASSKIYLHVEQHVIYVHLGLLIPPKPSIFIVSLSDLLFFRKPTSQNNQKAYSEPQSLDTFVVKGDKSGKKSLGAVCTKTNQLNSDSVKGSVSLKNTLGLVCAAANQTGPLASPDSSAFNPVSSSDFTFFRKPTKTTTSVTQRLENAPTCFSQNDNSNTEEFDWEKLFAKEASPPDSDDEDLEWGEALFANARIVEFPVETITLDTTGLDLSDLDLDAAIGYVPEHEIAECVKHQLEVSKDGASRKRLTEIDIALRTVEEERRALLKASNKEAKRQLQPVEERAQPRQARKEKTQKACKNASVLEKSQLVNRAPLEREPDQPPEAYDTFGMMDETKRLMRLRFMYHRKRRYCTNPDQLAAMKRALDGAQFRANLFKAERSNKVVKLQFFSSQIRVDAQAGKLYKHNLTTLLSANESVALAGWKSLMKSGVYQSIEVLENNLQFYRFNKIQDPDVKPRIIGDKYVSDGTELRKNPGEKEAPQMKTQQELVTLLVKSFRRACKSSRSGGRQSANHKRASFIKKEVRAAMWDFIESTGFNRRKDKRVNYKNAHRDKYTTAREDDVFEASATPLGQIERSIAISRVAEATLATNSKLQAVSNPSSHLEILAETKRSLITQVVALKRAMKDLKLEQRLEHQSLFGLDSKTLEPITEAARSASVAVGAFTEHMSTLMPELSATNSAVKELVHTSQTILSGLVDSASSACKWWASMMHVLHVLTSTVILVVQLMLATTNAQMITAVVAFCAQLSTYFLSHKVASVGAIVAAINQLRTDSTSHSHTDVNEKEVPVAELQALVPQLKDPADLCRQLHFITLMIERMIKYVMPLLFPETAKTVLRAMHEDDPDMFHFITAMQAITQAGGVQYACKNTSTAREVNDLWEKAQILQARWRPRGDASDKLFTQVYALCRSYKEAAGVVVSSERPATVVLYIHGTPGVGKSKISGIIAQDVCEAVTGKKEAPFNKAEKQDFWDSYQNHFAQQIDDIFQKSDSDVRSEQADNIMNAAHTVPFALNMAACEAKGTKYYNSKLIVASSNVSPAQWDAHDLKLADLNAFKRRIPFILELRPKQEFLRAGRVSDVVRKFDHDLIRETFGEPISVHALEYILNGAQCTYDDVVDALINQINDNERECEITREMSTRSGRASRAISPKKAEQQGLQVFDIASLDNELSMEEFMKDKEPWYKLLWAHVPPAAELAPLMTIGSALVVAVCSIVRAYTSSRASTAHESGALFASGDVRTSNRTRPRVVVRTNGKTQHESGLYASGDVSTASGKKVQYHVRQEGLSTKLNAIEEATNQLMGFDDFVSRPNGLATLAELELQGSGGEVIPLAHPVLVTPEFQGTNDAEAFSAISNALPNQLYLFVLMDKNGRNLGCAQTLQLVDYSFVAPYHVMCHLPEAKFMVFLGSKQLSIDVSLIHVVEEKPRDDLFFFDVDRCSGFTMGRDLTKKFLDESEIADVGSHAILVARIPTKEAALLFVAIHDLAVKTSLPSINNSVMRVAHCIEYKSAHTYRGMCGGIIVTMNRRSLGKFIGFHFAGYTGTYGGFGSIIPRKSLTVTRAAIQQMLIDLPSVHQDVVSVEQCKGREVIGQVPPSMCVNQPTKTSIRKSRLFDLFGPGTAQTKACMLVPFNGKDPMKIGQSKFYGSHHTISATRRSLIQKYMIAKLRALIVSEHGKCELRVLPWEETIAGSSEEYIDRINLKSSAGYPFNKATRGGGKGSWVSIADDNSILMAPELATRLTDYEALLKQGCVPPFVFTDTLKDERRPIEKVDAGKTRVFSAGPLDLTLLVRRFFLDFNAKIQCCRMIGPVSVGINPHSLEWRYLLDRLDLIPGNNYMAGDFSNFDGGMSAQFIDMAIHVIDSLYDDEFSIVRKSLSVALCNSLHISKKHIYRLGHSNTSGNPLTAVLNSLVNWAMHLYAYLEQGHDLAVIDKCVQFAFYGDDSMIKVHPDIPQFNMLYLRDVFSTIGSSLTPAIKGDVMQEFISLDQVTYLKRRFVWDGCVVLAPLDASSRDEMLYWTRAPVDEKEVEDELLVQVCGSHMDEMFHYGREAYEARADFLQKKLSSLGLIWVSRSYHQVVDSNYPELSSSVSL